MIALNTQQSVSKLHKALFAWWQSHGRVLPWREKLAAQDLTIKKAERSTVLSLREQAFTSYMANELRRDPYRVVVAEIMLQQTQVDRVMSKYLAWMTQWPTVADLAKAELSKVLIFWQGLGYNRRARFLWLLAKEVSENRGGEWPQTEAELVQLPGISRYTARAIMSFAFGQQVGVVDTNVKRVLRRLLDGQEAAATPTLSEKEWFIWADQIIPPGQADPWNQLIMDFGALICTAKAPKCLECPVQAICQAQQEAKRLGFPSYRELLSTQPASIKKKKAVRFEDTDRYFRGRVMDLLRERTCTKEELWQQLSTQHGLEPRERFEKVLAGLVCDSLAVVENGCVKLP